MTYPATMLLPSVAVYVDGQWVADGRNPYSTDPQVLTGLVVRWGRSTVVDQPQPSTCSLTLLDTQGGSRFLDSIQLGMRLDVVADALLATTPGPGTGVVVIDETFTSGPGNAYTLGPGSIQASGGALLVTSAGDQSASVVVPPGPRQPVGGNPAAWDAIPRAAQGQTWTASADVKLPAPFAGYSGWAVQVYPVTYDSPWDVATALDALGTSADLGNGWVRVSGEFIPPTGAWVGVQVRLWPTGPAWDELDPTTWDELPGAATVTNTAINPVPAALNGWTSNNGSQWVNTYAAGEVSVDRQAAAPANWAASLLSHGVHTPANPVLPVGTWWQRSVEVWVDAPGSIKPNIATGSWVGGQPLAAGQWTRVTENFQGEGVARYCCAIGVTINGVGTGVHSKFRRGMLVQVSGPTATPVPYFDGSTPDTPTMDYAWTGSPNASMSTATGLGVATTWDELGRMAVDNVSLKAPATGTQRTGMVFSGRITDMVAQFDDTAGGTLVEVTGADQRAELGNRDVGDEPWLEETLGSRFGRIVTASGQAIESRVSPTAAAMMVSWRDVDRQPAMTLLSELATSADGVLWAATHPTTGPYLLLESISDRKPQFLLVKVGGVITVVPADPAVTGAMVIDACDVLLEPIRWRHDIQDMATRVSVTWREQTLDDKGQPAPTDRTITQVNTGLETDIGVHRVAVGTQLSRQTDAQMVTDAVLARTSNTQWRVSGLDWRADTTDQLDADALARMMTLLDGTTRNGLPILLTNVPEWSPIPQDQGVALYLEGGVYTSTDGGWDLSLVTSSARAQGGSDVRWDDQPDGTLLGTNRATNPRAVSGGSAQWGQAGWGTGGAGSISYITGVTAPAGTNISTAFRKTWTTAATSATAAALALNGDASNRIPVTAGKTYTVSVFVRHNSIGTKNYEILLRWFNQVATSGGAQVGADVLSSAVSVADGVTWTRLSITVTAPAGALAMSVYPRIQIAATGAIPVNATQDGTGLLIEEAPAPVGAYFDGDTPDAAPIDYAWTGAANASTSTRTDLTTAWLWDQYGADVTWNSLHGVGIS